LHAWHLNDTRRPIRPEIARRYLAGESQVRIAADFKVDPSTICRIIARHERDELAAREAAKAVAGAAKLGELGVVIGDYRKTGECIADESVDLVFTDPPFERRHIKQYADLGRFAARVLKPGGSLITYIPDYALPQVLSLVLQPAELRFWWPLAVQHGGQTRVLDKFGINVRHKTLLWFVKGGQRARRAQVDSLVVSRPDKRYHAWGQGVVEAAYFIEKLTAPGGLVVDPYAGGGTTCVAAIAAGRQYVAFEKDRKSALKARGRVAASLG
jgi:SAM-dependent methyltransferase